MPPPTAQEAGHAQLPVLQPIRAPPPSGRPLAPPITTSDTTAPVAAAATAATTSAAAVPDAADRPGGRVSVPRTLRWPAFHKVLIHNLFGGFLYSWCEFGSTKANFYLGTCP